MTQNITDKAAINEHLIRALYAAKAEFKNASSDLYTAQHNLTCVVSTSSCAVERADAENARKEQEARYNIAEKTYDSVYALCRKVGAIS